jgi:hypothetical protein
MERDWLLHILRFLRFIENSTEIDKQADNYDHLWKTRTIFGTLNNAYKI